MNAPRLAVQVSLWGLLTLLCLPLRGWPPWEERDFILDWVADAGQQTSTPDGARGFVVAWVAPGPRGAGRDVFVHAFDRTGQPRWPARTANARAAGDQGEPSLAPLAGGFAMAWNSPGQDGSGQALVLRLFNAEGRPLGEERVVSEPSAGDQRGRLLALPAGGFAAVWTTPAPYGPGQRLVLRRFTGRSVGPAVHLRTFRPGETLQQVTPLREAEALLVVWSTGARRRCGFRAQRFGLDGTAQGDPFGLCTEMVSGAPAVPRVSVLVIAEQFVSVWRGRDGIRARRYWSDGVPRGPAFRVADLREGPPLASPPQVAHVSWDALLVVWEVPFPHCGRDHRGVAGRAFGPLEDPWSTGETLFDPGAADCLLDSREPQLAVGPDGRFSVTWKSSLPALKGTLFYLQPPPPLTGNDARP